MAKKHARYSPSALDSLDRCIRFKYDDTLTEDEATEGQLLHEAAETGDTGGLNPDQKEDVENALAYVEGLKTKLGLWEDLKEPRIELKDLTFGYADRVLFNRDTGELHVCDYKFTRVAGDHEFQVQTYAAGAIEERGVRPVSKVTTHVIAPRLNILESREHDPAQLLDQIRARIEALYERIDDPFNPPTPHGDLCAKCARAARCPALNQSAVAVARGQGLPLPAVFDPASMISTQDRALGHALASALENWAKQVKQQNTEFAKAGGDVPGYVLRSRSTGARVDKDDTALAIRILQANGYTDDEIYQACRLSINDIAKAHAAISTDSEKATKDRVKELLSAITSEGTATFLQKTKRVSDETLIKQLIQGV